MNGARVLVVDDEPQILRGLRVVLRRAGFQVDVAASVAEALDALAVRPPDALVLDLILPDGTGVDVLRDLRRWSSLPVLVLSGCRCSRSHSSALRDKDDAAAQVAGLGAFVDRRGVRQKLALADVRPSSPASIRAVISATVPQPGNPVRVAGEQDRERAAEGLRVRTLPGVVTRIISSPLRWRCVRRRRG